ncbi:SCO6880 family protein [Saccharothrix sp.]|uniref:SCO6880 family protein n=1 Tax=Saccharothrix sp. TaxID=1873460 RepID=UPI0028119FBA|nr:SCO6880 family protein [Saccharothrix sp.]
MSMRTYGGWRPRRGFGVGRLSEAQTAVVGVCVFAPLGTWMAISAFGLPLLILPVVLAVAAVTALLTLIPHRTHGTSLGGALVVWARTRTAIRKGWSDWESGIFTTHPRKHELPGVLAPIVPLSTKDGLGQPYGLLWDRRTGRLTAGVRVAPVGTVLADQERTDLWIGNFAAWQASLGYEPTIEHVAIVVESAPSTGTELADYVAERLDPAAPAIARETMIEVAEAHRGSTADISVRVNFTFQPQRARPAPADDAERVAEVSRALAGLEGDLPLTGVATLGRVTAAQWTHWLRGAYDPDARGELARLSEQGHLLAWADAGPVRAQTLNDHYWHDSGWSVSWAMSGLPTQNVTSNVLAPLVTPGRYHRRVCITYQPIPADQAGDLVTREASGSAFRRQLRRRRGVDDTARDRADEQRAVQAAEEEAQGAGVGLWAMYVTTTVSDPRQLPDAIADVEARARNAKLRLRRAWGWQHAAFAASQGVGINPPDLARRGRWAR